MQSVPFSQCQRATLVDVAASTGADLGQVKRTEAGRARCSIVRQAASEAAAGGTHSHETLNGYNSNHSSQI